jgi:hypothetical protein
MLHGASANHLTFVLSDGAVAGWLAERGFAPWLLNWRGSGLVVETNLDLLRPEKQGGRAQLFNFNEAAQHDIRRAIDAIRCEAGDVSIGAVGFCMGSAILAEAVARGCIDHNDVDAIVLMTLGLFYSTAIDGQVKTEDRILERLGFEDHGFLFVDPRPSSMEPRCTLRTSWPDDLEKLYQDWPAELKFHAADANQPLNVASEMCNRLGFMYGMPYQHGNLRNDIHDADTNAALRNLFGGIPLQMYIHGGRNIRQGRATFFDEHKRDREIVTDDARDRFLSIKNVTLITGALNRLWHRDSIDRMYDWLTRGKAEYVAGVRKVILPNYGHQDLLWGRKSSQEVFPEICRGLGSSDEACR